jgi:hypothetical protein
VNPTRMSWLAMMQRCTDPSHPRWEDYGGRGITVCERWRTFEAFRDDMGERPEGRALHRILRDGNYERANCMWRQAVPRQGYPCREVLQRLRADVSDEEWEEIIAEEERIRGEGC